MHNTHQVFVILNLLALNCSSERASDSTHHLPSASTLVTHSALSPNALFSPPLLDGDSSYFLRQTTGSWGRGRLPGMVCAVLTKLKLKSRYQPKDELIQVEKTLLIPLKTLVNKTIP